LSITENAGETSTLEDGGAGPSAATATPSDQQSEQTEDQQTTSKAEELEIDTETASAVTVGTLFAYPKVCRNIEQFQAWQKNRPWLVIVGETGGVKCALCAKVKRIGIHADKGQHIENAFVEGTVFGKDAKTLLKKVDKHGSCLNHVKCSEIEKMRESDRILESVQAARCRFEERHREDIEVTTKIFRTAYECIKSHMSFSEHSRLLELQSLNGVNCGNVLYSHHSCANITSHVAAEMRTEIVNHLLNSHAEFSILVDESTSVANTQSMIVYVRTHFEGALCVYFLGLLPLANASATGIESTLIDYLVSIGLTEDVLRKQFIGFCSDGASCMIGQYRGVASLLKAKFPLVKSFHCMAHRLELAVKNAVDDVNAISHFRSFVDALYKVYSMSPKNQRELSEVADSLSVELLEVQKVFDVRWVFSSFVSVKAVLRNVGALFVHFTQCSSPDSGRTGKERSKYGGLAKKLQSWLFVCEACMLKDALRCLKQLSLYLQSTDASIINAMCHIDDTRTKLLAMKTEDGRSVKKFMQCYDREGQYKNVTICRAESDASHFQSVRAQFFQGLHDNLVQRFPSTDLLANASCLERTNWPHDPLQKALYGEGEVAALCKEFGWASSVAADVVREFAIFKKTNGKQTGPNLHALIQTLAVLPISSAECERGFSQMNLYHTSERNKLIGNTVNDLLMVGINGPPLRVFNAKKYVLSWLQAGRHSALAKPTGLPKKEAVIKPSVRLFM